MAKTAIDVLKELIETNDDPPTDEDGLSALRAAGFGDIQPEEMEDLVNEAALQLVAEAGAARAITEFLRRHGYADLTEAGEQLNCSPQDVYEQALREAGLLGKPH
jgi:hypothetical protein